MLSLEVGATPKNGKKSSFTSDKTNMLIIAMGILLLVAVGSIGYLYYHFVLPGKQEVKSEETLLRDAVGSKILLPDESPQIATVTDKTKLADQPFFKKAENGDKILIFTNANRAVLYRPRIKKVIDTTTISLTPEVEGQNQFGTTPDGTGEKTAADDAVATEPDERLNIAIYNGSQKIGVTNTFDDEIKAMYQNIDVVLKETAKKSDYEKSVVVDLTERNAPFAKELASKINGETGKLPEGENAPENTDILIILGNNDYKQVP
jgi:hypothetical protein